MATLVLSQRAKAWAALKNFGVVVRGCCAKSPPKPSQTAGVHVGRPVKEHAALTPGRNYDASAPLDNMAQVNGEDAGQYG
jgi:hypothetical protein